MPTASSVLLVFVGMGAAAARPTAPTCRPVGRPQLLANVPEASGIAVSRRAPGTFWTHNDSGNRRSTTQIAVYRTVDPRDENQLATVETFLAAYPDAPHDAEALLITPQEFRITGAAASQDGPGPRFDPTPLCSSIARATSRPAAPRCGSISRA